MDNIKHTISTNDKYGIYIQYENSDISDKFEDFIIERSYVLFGTVFNDSKTIFYAIGAIIAGAGNGNAANGALREKH